MEVSVRIAGQGKRSVKEEIKEKELTRKEGRNDEENNFDVLYSDFCLN